MPSPGPISAPPTSSPRSRRASAWRPSSPSPVHGRRRASWPPRWCGWRATNRAGWPTQPTFLLPKDYLRLRLTGVAGTDISDASATALFDIAAADLVERAVPTTRPPDGAHAAAARVGRYRGTPDPSAAAELGLEPGIPVVAGSADQPAQAVANGLLDAGSGSITLGSGSQTLVATDRPVADRAGRIHTFCHAVPDRWYHLGATLSAGTLAALAARSAARCEFEGPVRGAGSRWPAVCPPAPKALPSCPIWWANAHRSWTPTRRAPSWA